MTITQIHQPALWEGGCGTCTTYYRDQTEQLLAAAFYSGLMIDTWLRAEFAIIHKSHS